MDEWCEIYEESEERGEASASHGTLGIWIDGLCRVILLPGL